MSIGYNLISKGFLPAQLPTPFNSLGLGESYSEVSRLAKKQFKSKWTWPCRHNAARSKCSRRILSIPNPVHFTNMVTTLEDLWVEINNALSMSKYTMTKPVECVDGERGLTPEFWFDSRPEKRAEIRSNARYVVHADVAQFYSSIYTHSIAWVLHGKEKAKKSKKNKNLIGNILDVAIRSGQGGQTIGIPVGPDTSLVIGELVLSAVDSKLIENVEAVAFRYMDDYEFGCLDYQKAEQTITKLEKCLADYELSLNPSKVYIEELPTPIESLWASTLRDVELNNDDSDEFKFRKIKKLFDTVYSNIKCDSSRSMTKFAINILSGITFNYKTFTYAMHSVMQLSTIDPAVSPHAFKFLVELYNEYKDYFERNKQTVNIFVNTIISRCADSQMANEVAWAIWFSIVVNIEINDTSLSKAIKVPDSIIGLLLMHAKYRKTTSTNGDFSTILRNINKEALARSNWMLAYELATKKTWGASDTGILSGNVFFSALYELGISFYDDSDELIQTFIQDPIAFSSDY